MTKHPEFQPLDSSLFEGMHYDPPTNRLTVKFKNGDVWLYKDVPHDRAETFSGSASPGKYFGAHIKGLYRAEKLK